MRAGRVELYGVSIPSAKLGGDLVDAVLLSGGSVFAYVADVSATAFPPEFSWA